MKEFRNGYPQTPGIIMIPPVLLMMRKHRCRFGYKERRFFIQ